MTKSFGAYLREMREQKGLPLRKVAAQLDVDTSILSKIERDERNATVEMLPIFSKVLERNEKEVQTKFLEFTIKKNYEKLIFLKDGLNEIIKNL
jgi:transcriptional regulator with XRE-family HTH domain